MIITVECDDCGMLLKEPDFIIDCDGLHLCSFCDLERQIIEKEHELHEARNTIKIRIIPEIKEIKAAIVSLKQELQREDMYEKNANNI